jgi:hypothetical protein
MRDAVDLNQDQNMPGPVLTAVLLKLLNPLQQLLRVLNLPKLFRPVLTADLCVAHLVFPQQRKVGFEFLVQPSAVMPNILMEIHPEIFL